MKTANYYGTKFKIDEQTLDITADTFCKTYLNTKLNRWYVCWLREDGKMSCTPRARIICQAWHPNANYKHLQTDHIDNNTANDSPDNLRWLTRKQNNSTEHSKRMKSLNSKHADHTDELIKAYNAKTDETKWFRNGRHAAEALNCSHVLVYKALSKDSYVKTAKGWTLEWMKANKHNIEKLEDRKNNTMANSATLKKQLDKISKRIEIWLKHIEWLKHSNDAKIQNIYDKVEKLKAEAAKTEAKIEAYQKAENV